METEIIAIDPAKKEITYRTSSGEEGTDTYDKLILSPGSAQVELDFIDMDLENITFFAGPAAAELIRERLDHGKKAVVVGAGYIGIEAVSSFLKAGVDVTLVDMQERILPNSLDKEFTDIIEADLKERGAHLQLGEKLTQILSKEGKVTGVQTDQGSYEADTVIIALGVRPNTDWLEGLLDLEDGYVVVDSKGQTSLPDVYAAGDAVKVTYTPTGKKAPIALAPIARKEGAIATKNALGQAGYRTPEFQGTSGLHLFDYYFASTGLKEVDADQYDGEVASHYVEEKIYVDFLHEEDNLIMMKIYYDQVSERILGAQLMAKNHDITPAINTLVVAIQAGWSLYQLGHADFFFQPDLNRPWNYLNYLALSAREDLYGADQLLF